MYTSPAIKCHQHKQEPNPVTAFHGDILKRWKCYNYPQPFARCEIATVSNKPVRLLSPLEVPCISNLTDQLSYEQLLTHNAIILKRHSKTNNLHRNYIQSINSPLHVSEHLPVNVNS